MSLLLQVVRLRPRNLGVLLALPVILSVPHVSAGVPAGLEGNVDDLKLMLLGSTGFACSRIPRQMLLDG